MSTSVIFEKAGKRLCIVINATIHCEEKSIGKRSIFIEHVQCTLWQIQEDLALLFGVAPLKSFETQKSMTTRWCVCVCVCMRWCWLESFFFEKKEKTTSDCCVQAEDRSPKESWILRKQSTEPGIIFACNDRRPKPQNLWENQHVCIGSSLIMQPEDNCYCITLKGGNTILFNRWEENMTKRKGVCIVCGLYLQIHCLLFACSEVTSVFIFSHWVSFWSLPAN